MPKTLESQNMTIAQQEFIDYVVSMLQEKVITVGFQGDQMIASVSVPINPKLKRALQGLGNKHRHLSKT